MSAGINLCIGWIRHVACVGQNMPNQMEAQIAHHGYEKNIP